MDNKRNNRRKNERKELICAATAVVVLYTAMESIGITCPIKFITGISCAGCGMSRAWKFAVTAFFAKIAVVIEFLSAFFTVHNFNSF